MIWGMVTEVDAKGRPVAFVIGAEQLYEAWRRLSRKMSLIVNEAARSVHAFSIPEETRKLQEQVSRLNIERDAALRELEVLRSRLGSAHKFRSRTQGGAHAEVTGTSPRQRRLEATRALATVPDTDPVGRSAALSVLGDALRETGDLNGATAAYQEALVIRRRLAATQPDHAEWQRDLAVSLDRAGDVASASGDLTAARNAHTEALSIRRALATADPTSIANQQSLSVSLDNLGDFAVASGDLTAARNAYTEALSIRRALAAADPTNIANQQSLSVSLDNLGDLARASCLENA